MIDQYPCRACLTPRRHLVLDLGCQPLANDFLRAEDFSRTETRIPLRLVVCPNCWLMQISDEVPPARLFSDYLYFTSFSDTMLRHSQQAAERYIADFHLGATSQVVEIASNDGYLLKHLIAHNIPCLGIEPAANIARVAQGNGIPTLIDFFGDRLATQLVRNGQQADLIIGNNVFAHVPTINDFVSGLKRLLKPQGRIVLEFPYGFDLIVNREFDTIYHEHVFYFTLTALRPCFGRHELQIFQVERLPIHGGSLRIFVGHQGDRPEGVSVSELLAIEQAAGVASLKFYEAFARQVQELKDNLLQRLRQFKKQGCRIAAYGASAKGSTLLNYFGLTKDLLDFVADRSTYKQGRFTPGTRLPILPPTALLERQPDYTLLLTWNFSEEILAQQQPYRDRGGKFIIPIPQLVIV